MGMAKSKDDLIIEQLQRDNKELREENERVRQANLHTMDVFEDMKAAKEKAEARAAELEAEALYLRARDDALVDFLCNESGVDLMSVKAACGHIPIEDAWLLRKQAEAVESFLSQQAPLLDRYRPQPINEEDHCCEFNLLRDRERLHSEAQRLRQQADEAERAGGEQ